MAILSQTMTADLAEVKPITSHLPTTARRGMLWLLSGSAAGQAAAFALAPALTRLYTPEEFGTYNLFTSVVALVSVLAMAKFDLAIPVARSDEDAVGLGKVSLLSLGAVLLGVMVVLVASRSYWIETWGIPYNLYLIFLPASLACCCLFQLAVCYATRQKRFGPMSFARLASGVFSPAAQIVAAIIATQGAVGLFVGAVVGPFAGFAILCSKLGATLRRLFSFSPAIGVHGVVVRYRNFPLFSTWGSLLNVASLHVPVFLITRLFGVETTGQFSLSMRFVFLPVYLIQNVVGQVFLSGAAEALKNNVLHDRVSRIYGCLSAAAYLAFIPFGLFAPEIFQLTFGANWREAGIYAAMLTPWLILSFTGSPLSFVTTATQRQKAELIFQAILFALRVTALILGARWYGAAGAVALFAVVSALLWLGYNIWIFSIVHNSIAPFVTTTINNLKLTLPVIVVSLCLRFVPGDPLTNIILVTLFAGTLIYSGFLVYKKYVCLGCRF
jgi:O-antigen/teichoic acid export membrane protein